MAIAFAISELQATVWDGTIYVHCDWSNATIEVTIATRDGGVTISLED